MKTTAVQVKPGLEQSRRCLAACRQQAAIHNRAMRELIEHPDEPVASRDGTPAEGLLGRRADWSREEPWIRQVPEPAWQAAIMVAKLRHEAWKRSRGARAAESDERHGRHSRNGHRRTAELFIRQKRQERRNASIYRVLGGVRIHDARRIEIPGIGILETVEKLPVTEHTGSAAVVETKRSRRNGSSRRGWRTWTVRIDHTSAAEAAERAPATEEETPAGSETEAKEADGNAAVTATEEAAAETPAAEVAEAEDDGAANGAGSERGEAVDESLWAYRLVEATTGGASSIDRKGYGTVASARAARKQDGLESITAIARVRRAETDLLQIDGEWVAGATPALDYGVGDERPSLPGARTAAERVEAGAIVAETVPEAWRGLALTDAQGNGVVWTGDTFGPVAGHLYEENGRLVYAWSERATKAWRERTADSALERERDRSALVAVDAGERREWNLPRGTAYLLLEPEVDGSPVRNAVPVLEEEIAQLAAADGLRPETTAGPFYRPAVVSADGWRKRGREAFTNPARAREAARETAGAVVVESDGLADDVTAVDGRPSAGSEPAGPRGRERAVAHRADAVGSVALDDDGNGYAYDGRKLVRIENGRVADGAGGPAGMPAWVYGVLARARPSPREPNVRGVLVALTSADRRRWQLPDNAHQALVTRRGKSTEQLEVQLVTRTGMEAWRRNESHLIAVGTASGKGAIPETVAGSAGPRRVDWIETEGAAAPPGRWTTRT